MAEEKKAGSAKEGGILDGLSLSQVVAAALAAVTSLFLASQIGIAGSLIGAAVSSVVATVSSQVYKRFLAASAEKIKEIRPEEAGGLDDLARLSREAAKRASQETATKAAEGVRTSERATVVMPALSPTPRLGGADEDLNPTAIKARAERARRKRAQAMVVGVTVVSALVAVLLSAGAIYFVTAGEGVGSKPAAPFVSTAGQASSSASGPSEAVEVPSSGSSVEEGAQGEGASEGGSSEGPAGGGAESEGLAGEGSTGEGGVGSDASDSVGSDDGSADAGGSSSGSAGSGADDPASSPGASGPASGPSSESVPQGSSEGADSTS